jgi:hypothetical protein
MSAADNTRTPPFGHSVICTDRGRHRPVVLAKFAKAYWRTTEPYDDKPGICWFPYRAPGTLSGRCWREDLSESRWVGGQLIRKYGSRELAEHYAFTCKRCSRRPRLSQASLVGLLDAWNDAQAANLANGTPHVLDLDISQLPY